MIIKNTKNKYFNSKGFALLFSIVVSSIILFITLGISSVASKQSLISTSVKNSDTALFAADSGIECALYLDNSGAFIDSAIPAQCLGIELSFPSSPVIGGQGVTSFIAYELGINNQGCAIITVEKDTDSVTSIVTTKITSKGYNVADVPATCSYGGNRTERRLEVTF